jgi:beta-galactosidase
MKTTLLSGRWLIGCRYLSLALLWSLANPALAAKPVADRQQYNFNPEWRVLVGDPTGAQNIGFDDKGWKKVTLPYAWNEDEAFQKDIKDLSTGVAWYRKHFRLPAGSIGQKVYIEFEGVRQAGEFYLNGHNAIFVAARAPRQRVGRAH